MIVLVAIPVGLILFIICFIFGIIRYILPNSNKRYFIHVSVAIDQMIQVVGAPLFNLILIKKDGLKFGSFGHSISYYIAVNKQVNQLNWFGRLWAWLLGEQHLQKTIRNEKNSTDN